MTIETTQISCGLLELHHLLGRKWTYGLLYNLSPKPLSFTEIQGMANNAINPTLLSNRLKELVSFGIVERTQEDARVYYAITPKGEKLKKVLFDLKLVAEDLGVDVPTGCIGKDCAKCHSFLMD